MSQPEPPTDEIAVDDDGGRRRGAPMPRAETDWGLVEQLLPYLKPEWPLYLLAMLCAPASALLTIVQPYLLKLAIDDYIRPGDIAGIQTVAWWFLGAVLIGFAMEAVYTVSISYGALSSITRLRRTVYEHTMDQAQAFFDVRPTGRLLTRATSDIESLGETMTAGAMTIVLDVLVVIGILIAMFAMEPKLTGLLLLFAPPVAFALDRIRRVLRRLYREVRDSLAELNAFTSERLTGLRVLQLYSDEGRAQAQYDERVDRYKVATVRTNVWDALLYAIVDGTSSITVAFMLWYGAGGLVEDALTAGTLVAFIDYTGKLFRPIQEFSSKVAVLQRATAALEKIFGLLDHDESIHRGELDLEQGTGEIRVRGLTFAYGEGPDVLHDVDLDLNPGEVVAVVGRTGSGKSTLAKLLTRTYDDYRGSITLDGVELTDLDPKAVRRTIGMVRQDVQIFPGDVRFNLALGRDLGEEQILEAVRLCHAEPAVDQLGGLGGRVAHEGANLSVGEAQLLSFARTMAHDPPVVILDEATASVDTLTEARIQAATDAVLERKTVLVIAHRLSTIMHSDRILVLSDGRVIEQGSHDELMEADGRYAELFRQQFEEQALEATA